MSSYWDVCEYCGSTNLAFYDIGVDKATGKDLTEIHCDDCGDAWDDYTENYPWAKEGQA